MGSGRCGTASLADLLSCQSETKVTHEFTPIPWVYEKQYWEWALDRMLTKTPPYDREVIGDVGYYWLPYVDKWVETRPEVKFICLWRNRQEVMDSMWEHSRGLNVNPDDEWYRMYPYYSNADKYEAIGLMWDDYMEMSRAFRDKYPDKFILMEMNKALNDEYSQRKMLKFAGFKNPQTKLGIKKNTRNA